MERNDLKVVMMVVILSVILVLVLVHADHPSSSLTPSPSLSIPSFRPLPSTPLISVSDPFDFAGKHRKGLRAMERNYSKEVLRTKAGGCIRKCNERRKKYKFLLFEAYLWRKCMKDCLHK